MYTRVYISEFMHTAAARGFFSLRRRFSRFPRERILRGNLKCDRPRALAGERKCARIDRQVQLKPSKGERERRGKDVDLFLVGGGRGGSLKATMQILKASFCKFNFEALFLLVCIRRRERRGNNKHV